MAFNARLIIQGVGVTRLSDDGQSLESFFPTNFAAMDFGLLNQAGAPVPVGATKIGQLPLPVCEHYAFIQFSARQLDPANDPVWLTAILDKERVDVEVSGAGVKPLEVGANGQVEAMASLREILSGVVADPRILRTDLATNRAKLLNAEVHVPRGKAKGYLPRRWKVGPKPQLADVEMSGAVQVELGDVDELALRITSFDKKTSRTLRLHPKPPANDCEVWIRHYCSFGFPNLSPPVKLETGDTDPDFVLNYALIEGVRSLTTAQIRQLPAPEVTLGGQIGGNHTICMGAGG